MAKQRARVPVGVRRELLMEAGYRCAVPTCRNILAVDLHHIIQLSEGGGNEPSNLIVLCGVCHDLYHKGEITKEAIRNWKGMLVALNHAFDRESIDNLLFLRKLSPGELPITADGVLNFSRLIAAGLASFNLHSHMHPQQAFYEVRLSPKGRMLVDAWFRGDRDALESALAEG